MMVNQVTIVIPIWKNDLSIYEEISLRQCLNVLYKYNISFVTYKGLKIDNILSIVNEYNIKFELIFFDKKFFSSIIDYNSLMLSIRFYIRFIDYKYVLIYQLDCFVFRDELEFWVDQGFSYIGAPWLKGWSSAELTSEIIGVGNGGFSLRHVFHHIKAILIYKFFDFPLNFMDFVVIKLLRIKGIRLLKNRLIDDSNSFLCWKGNEDIFWNKVSFRFNWYNIPDGETAAKFSVEVQPRRFCNQYSKLPFGCHAWWKYDLNFWKPHIENFNHKL